MYKENNVTKILIGKLFKIITKKVIKACMLTLMSKI